MTTDEDRCPHGRPVHQDCFICEERIAAGVRKALEQERQQKADIEAKVTAEFIIFMVAGVPLMVAVIGLWYWLCRLWPQTFDFLADPAMGVPCGAGLWMLIMIPIFSSLWRTSPSQ